MMGRERGARSVPGTHGVSATEVSDAAALWFVANDSTSAVRTNTILILARNFNKSN